MLARASSLISRRRAPLSRPRYQPPTRNGITRDSRNRGAVPRDVGTGDPACAAVSATPAAAAAKNAHRVSNSVNAYTHEVHDASMNHGLHLTSTVRRTSNPA